MIVTLEPLKRLAYCSGLGADMLKEIRVKQEKRASVIPLPRWKVMTMIKVKTKHLMFEAGGEKPL